MATVTSSRNLSYHYTPRLGFKARTPALKHTGRAVPFRFVARTRESMRIRLARLTCARNHVRQNSTNHFHIIPITYFLPGSPTCSEWPRRVLEASTKQTSKTMQTWRCCRQGGLAQGPLRLHKVSHVCGADPYCFGGNNHHAPGPSLPVSTSDLSWASASCAVQSSERRLMKIDLEDLQRGGS